VGTQLHSIAATNQVFLRDHHPIARNTFMIWIVEACAAQTVNIEMFAAPGLWIIVQAEKLNLLKAQLQGAQVRVHYRGLPCQDLGR